ncbi:hypothetical protein QFZ55_000207 [Streptomyces luteogriseus]|uniref:hypothetical protein n=1 Tax=Streptomyces luteogriseus TaxID=68233 RepID=UPI002787F283|nr:hypothetical protein [Streptomyces luteogriseus]MDQ0710755.1 hypothetical protein [Streptomyces luteogriseus]
MNDALAHPEAVQLMNSLVASEGGLVSYGYGLPDSALATPARSRPARGWETSRTLGEGGLRNRGNGFNDVASSVQFLPHTIG